jgi:glycosyltransferase involved in cell wall biosynthesis
MYDVIGENYMNENLITTDEILFSVVIPAFNAEKFIGDAIKSIEMQNPDSYEIIVVDDGSTDGTKDILFDLAKLNPKIKIICQENKGSFATRFVGINAARGEYIVSLDADDQLIPGAFEVLRKNIRQYNKPDIICFGATHRSDFKSDSVTKFHTVDFGTETPDISKVRSVLLSTDRINNVCFKIIRKDLFDDVLTNKQPLIATRLNMADDKVTCALVFDNARTVVCLKDCLYYYRPNNNSMTQMRNYEKDIEDIAKTFNLIDPYIDKWGLESRKKECHALTLSQFGDELVGIACQSRGNNRETCFQIQNISSIYLPINSVLWDGLESLTPHRRFLLAQIKNGRYNCFVLYAKVFSCIMKLVSTIRGR